MSYLITEFHFISQIVSLYYRLSSSHFIVPSTKQITKVSLNLQNFHFNSMYQNKMLLENRIKRFKYCLRILTSFKVSKDVIKTKTVKNFLNLFDCKLIKTLVKKVRENL